MCVDPPWSCIMVRPCRPASRPGVAGALPFPGAPPGSLVPRGRSPPGGSMGRHHHSIGQEATSAGAIGAAAVAAWFLPLDFVAARGRTAWWKGAR
jgi:hypothetical protein